jgi:AcrR family transcriptional regulator
MAKSSRESLIQAALELFLEQGVNQTTTRQIADRAGVNEVTLFRNFGNKYGLLQAVLNAAPTFRDLGEGLMEQTIATSDRHQTLKTYAGECLAALEQAPAFVRSLIGEAGQFPEENRQALGHRLQEASQYVAQYLEHTMPARNFAAGQLSGYLGALLVGYVVIESTSDDHGLWTSRENFLDGLVGLLLGETLAFEADAATAPSPEPVQDLPAPCVHQILTQAKAASPQDFALAYLLLAAGLDPAEVVSVTRSQHRSAKTQHTLQLCDRQVPINQWIWGKRYGTYTSNPLTKWLKSRKDESPWLFIQEDDDPIGLSVEDIAQKWASWAQELPLCSHSHPGQAKPTWCVEMLTRGMSVDNLSLLSGLSPEQLQPYVQRAREKAALEEARQLDQK